MTQTTIAMIVYMVFPIFNITDELPFDPDFMATASRYDIKESFLKRTMVFTDTATGEQTKCKYGGSWVTSKGNSTLSRDESKKAKARQKIFNGFNKGAYKVKAVAHMDRVETVLGEATSGDSSLVVLDRDSGAQIGFFDLNVGSETILSGQLNKNPVFIKERVLHEDRRLPLFNTRYFPVPTTGFFTFSGKEKLFGCLVIHQSWRQGYSLYLAESLTTEEKAEAVTLMLLFPMFRSIGSQTLR